MENDFNFSNNFVWNFNKKKERKKRTKKQCYYFIKNLLNWINYEKTLKLKLKNFPIFINSLLKQDFFFFQFVFVFPVASFWWNVSEKKGKKTNKC